MPFGGRVQCLKCKKDESLMWHTREKGVVCSDCVESEQILLKVEEEQPKPSAEKVKTPAKKSTKTTRSYKTRQNPNALPKQVSLKGKGRRNIFKKNPPVKLHAAPATLTTTNTLKHKGQLFRSGDIVSLRDVDGDIYYAQIQLMMMDEYCEKSASIQWLVPTKNNSPFARKGFDPMTYIYGPPSDGLSIKLDCMEFVMHAPSDYYRDNSPFPSGMPDPRASSYIWTRLGRL